MRKLFTAALLGAISLATGPSFAAEKITGVVEMFTSQGCSSCPPADKIVTKLNNDPSVLVLAWHVDYWDYLGWKDTLGLKGATERQRGYAANFQSASIYTPQAVINGAAGMVGSREREIRNALESVPFPALEVSIEKAGEGYTVVLPQLELNGASTMLELVTFVPEAVVEIERGENAGESIIYQNAVTKVKKLGVWDGSANRFQAVAAKNGQGSAVLVRTLLSTGEAGPIIGAAVLDPA